MEKSLTPFAELFEDRVRSLDRTHLESFTIDLFRQYYSLYRSQIAQDPEQADRNMMDILRPHDED